MWLVGRLIHRLVDVDRKRDWQTEKERQACTVRWQVEKHAERHRSTWRNTCMWVDKHKHRQVDRKTGRQRIRAWHVEKLAVQQAHIKMHWDCCTWPGQEPRSTRSGRQSGKSGEVLEWRDQQAGGEGEKDSVANGGEHTHTCRTHMQIGRARNEPGQKIRFLGGFAMGTGLQSTAAWGRGRSRGRWWGGWQGQRYQAGAGSGLGEWAVWESHFHYCSPSSWSSSCGETTRRKTEENSKK